MLVYFSLVKGVQLVEVRRTLRHFADLAFDVSHGIQDGDALPN